MELFTVTGKLKKIFLWQLEMFDVCRVTCDAHIEYFYLSKTFFSFHLTVNNTIKVRPLGFLL